MRHRRFARNETFGDHLAHAAEIDPRAFAGLNLRGGRRLRLRVLGFPCRANVALSNAAFRASPFDAGKINAQLSRDPSRQRRSLHTRFAAAFRFWFSRRFCLRSLLRLGRFLLRLFVSLPRRRGLGFLLFRRRRFLRLCLLLLFRRGLFLFFRFRRRLLLFLFRWSHRSCLTFATDKGDLVAHVHLAAFFDVNLGQRPVFRRLPFHRRLVRLDLGNDVARRNLIALFLFPRDEGPLRHRVT